jgi:hypothetical protein
MALSALVNSPVEQPRPLLSPSPNHYPSNLPTINPYASTSTSNGHHIHPPPLPPLDRGRYASPEPPYPYRSNSGYDDYHPAQSTSTYRRSPSPVYAYRNGSGTVVGRGGSGRASRSSRSPVKRSMGIAMRMGDKLVGNEDVWEGGLQQYQRRREAEVDDLAALTLEDIVSHLSRRTDCADRVGNSTSTR